MEIVKPKFQPAPDPAGGVTPSTAEALKMKKDLESAIKEIENAEQYNQYLEIGEKAELEKSKALLKSDVAALDYFLKTGDWMGPVLPAEAIAQPKIPVLTEVDQGWYTFDNTTGQMSEPKMDDNVISIEDTGVIDQGKPVPTNLWFVMKSDSDPAKDMVGVTGKNVGSDVEVTVTYADNHKETFKVKNGATRRDVQIGVVGLKSDHGVTMDFSQTLIVDKKTGEKSGVYLIGSRHDDRIYGSAGSFDEINGAGGADTLDGMDGSDHVYGYASEGIEGVQATYSADELGIDGDDQISDRFGIDKNTDDSIDGGEGWDTVLRNNDELATPRVEDSAGLDTSDPNDIKNWFSGWSTESTGSELLVSQANDNQKTITIKEAEGYMMSGTKDGNDLILNVVKEGKFGDAPSYYKVRVKDYFSTSGVKLDITGGFVDLNGIDVGINSVNLTGTENSGDVLIGPKTIFEEYAFDVDDLGTGTLKDSELADKLKPFQENVDTNPVWGNASVDKGAIVVEGATITGEPPELNIPGALDSVAFVQHDEDGWTITVASNEGFNSERIVIKVKSPPAGLVVKINGFGADSGYVFDLGSTVDAGVTIDGVDGTDYTAGYKFGTAFADDTTGIELGFAAPADHLGDMIGSAKTSDDFATQISEANDFAKLDEYQSKVDNMTKKGSQTQKDAQKAINERRAELIHDEIVGTLNSLQKKIDNAEVGSPEETTAKAARDAKVEEIQAQLEILKDQGANDLYNKEQNALKEATEE